MQYARRLTASLAIFWSINLNKYTNLMSPNIYLIRLIGSMMLIMLPVGTRAQDHDREEILLTDIRRLGERAMNDMVISHDEHEDLMDFVRDSLPEGRSLRINALEKVRDELDRQYEDMVRQSRYLFDETGYIGQMMLPKILHEPEGYVSNSEKQRRMQLAGLATTRELTERYMKSVEPLKMNRWVKTLLRLCFGNGVNQRPERWDQIVVPQMNGLYFIVMPGGQPDYSWTEAPKMEYDPYPDRHFRH